MTDTDIKAMCDSAMVRVSGFISRSAGQHIRQMREQQQMTDSEFLADLLYCAHMGELPEATIAEACERFRLDFPPSPFKGFQATRQAPVFQTSEVNHGIHRN